jgi:hypothetical protein
VVESLVAGFGSIASGMNTTAQKKSSASNHETDETDEMIRLLYQTCPDLLPSAPSEVPEESKLRTEFANLPKVVKAFFSQIVGDDNLNNFFAPIMSITQLIMSLMQNAKAMSNPNAVHGHRFLNFSHAFGRYLFMSSNGDIRLLLAHLGMVPSPGTCTDNLRMILPMCGEPGCVQRILQRSGHGLALYMTSSDSTLEQRDKLQQASPMLVAGDNVQVHTSNSLGVKQVLDAVVTVGVAHAERLCDGIPALKHVSLTPQIAFMQLLPEGKMLEQLHGQAASLEHAESLVKEARKQIADKLTPIAEAIPAVHAKLEKASGDDKLVAQHAATLFGTTALIQDVVRRARTALKKVATSDEAKVNDEEDAVDEHGDEPLKPALKPFASVIE